ncbi:MAG TPA: cytochrome b/b6 domain-containing protein [Bacteroidales bacterium]|jgi:thiosulfate reductase cytochrome b subunit|nr:cytochrome b/b6 domain-containing protein [Bacteroidales bacterium]HOS71838.1 cytochrome b/b6 domain-containing protein [Bacteroidales bacterium]HQH22966.1 cytochrome b/b6 domain-containing protein [Bacteroidales bacterium]HQJ82129.1 cytochrome b/b6 domain-containing protein [Bacteroidales bacterium]
MYLYPLGIRLWHALNAILIIILIITGISMQYTDKGNLVFIIDFAAAVKWHNITAIILVISYIFFLILNIVSGNAKYYRINRNNLFSDLGKQFRYYVSGMFKGEKHPFPVSMESKFNPLQKLTYVLIMYAGLPLIIISGFGMMFPEITIVKLFGVSGFILTDILHITMAFLVTVFLVIHIYTCTLGTKPTSLFRGMITGYHEPEEESPEEVSPEK